MLDTQYFYLVCLFMELISETVVFQGKLIEVVHQLVKVGDKELTWEIARRSPGVRLIICDQDKILLTKEFRREYDGFDYRLPWGKVFDTLEEYNANKNDIERHALIAVKRECGEETWLIPQDVQLYHLSKVWATIERDLYYYVIKQFTHHEQWQQLELWEDITVEWKSKEEILAIIKAWEMHEDRSVGVLLRYLS